MMQPTAVAALMPAVKMQQLLHQQIARHQLTHQQKAALLRWTSSKKT
jgi:hypothetical protein